MKKIILLLITGSFFPALMNAQTADVDKLIPINELGTGTFKNHMGGLYPNGSNEMPAAFYNDAVAMANSVQPLNKAGQPDSKGTIGLIALGASTVAMFSKGLETMIPKTNGIDNNIRFVNCGIGGQELSKIMSPSANFWSVIDGRITAAGMTLAQVQVLWFQEDNLKYRANDLDERGNDLVDDFAYMVRFCKQHYPNLKLFYVSGRHTTAFIPADAPDKSEKHREPKSYVNGWACKWLIEKQIDGDAQLNYKGDNAVAPLILWGPYFWTQGDKPRKDGYSWTPEFLTNDGVHPNEAGIQRISKELIDFWRSDPVSQMWFLENPSQIAQADYMNVVINNKTVNQIAYNDISDNFRVMVLKDSLVVYNNENGHKQDSLKIELKEPGTYKYVITDESSHAFASGFAVNSDLAVEGINEFVAPQNDSVVMNYSDPNAPAWIVNGMDKLPKITRLMKGHTNVKAVMTDGKGTTVTTVDDILHSHTDLNEILEKGEYILKFYDEDGSEIALPEDFKSAVRIKY